MNTNINDSIQSSSLITPVLHEGELRILDTDLAQRLGFVKPTKIRELITRHTENLLKMGVLPTVGKTPSSAGGRPSTEYYLNRKQAIFVTAKSETKEATEITIEIIERFEAYEQHKIALFSIPQTYAEALRLAADQAEEIKELKPKAEALERIAVSDGSICITNAAKDLQIRPKELFDYLLQKGWIYRRNGNATWLAYQDKIQQGLLEHKVTEVSRSDGTTKIIEQAKITPKGLVKLAELLNRKAA